MDTARAKTNLKRIMMNLELEDLEKMAGKGEAEQTV